eukprot:3370687-Prymnesium_polylepis.1
MERGKIAGGRRHWHSLFSFGRRVGPRGRPRRVLRFGNARARSVRERPYSGCLRIGFVAIHQPRNAGAR